MRTTALILGFMATRCRLASPASAKDIAVNRQASRGDFDVTVYVVQSCPTPAALQMVAQTTAAELFARIDVSVRFIYSAPPKDDRDGIVLRFIEHAPEGTGPNVLGSARMNPIPRRQVNAYCDRIREFFTIGDWHAHGQLTGYVIAHELGHILRSEPGHSPGGIMRACWRQRDIVPMLQGAVRFLPADAEQIREAIAERRLRLVRPGEN